jgi:hypothetical protein
LVYRVFGCGARLLLEERCFERVTLNMRKTVGCSVRPTVHFCRNQRSGTTSPAS